MKKYLSRLLFCLFMCGSVFAVWRTTNRSTYDMIAKRILFTSDGTTGGTSVLDTNSGGNIIVYGQLLNGSGVSYVASNATGFLTGETDPVFLANSGVYFNANSGTYYNSNPKGYITGGQETDPVYIAQSGNYVRRTSVSTGTSGGSSDTLLMSQNAISGFVNSKVASAGGVSGTGTNAYLCSFSGTTAIKNSMMYEKSATSIWIGNSETFLATAGTYKFGGTNYQANTDVIVGLSSQTNYAGIKGIGLGAIGGSFKAVGINTTAYALSIAQGGGSPPGTYTSYGYYATRDNENTQQSNGAMMYLKDNSTLANGDIMTIINRAAKTTFRINTGGSVVANEISYMNSGLVLGNNTNTCTGTLVGGIIFSGDNFYGCNVASGWIQLN